MVEGSGDKKYMNISQNISQMFKKIGASRLIQLLKSDEIMMSLHSMKEHKTRTFLTMLGIIFGVGAVISMLAIGEGARRKALDQISSLGLKNIIIRNQSDTQTDSNIPLLEERDVEALLNIVEDLEYGTGLITMNTDVKYESLLEDRKIVGTTPAYFQMMELDMKAGGFFSDLDNRSHNRVCVVGSDIARDLFKLKSAPGKRIKIGDQWFYVTGVLDYKPVSTAGNTQINYNKHIFVPLNSMRLRYERDPKKAELDQIVVHVGDREKVLGSSEIIEKVIFRRHNSTKNFEMVVPEELLRQSEETQRIFNIVMGAIAGISLLVGGIGIMNIMLASILERTREIGLRRSIGATKNDIKAQFLTESILLSLGGGITGILLGYILTYIVTLSTDWNTAVTLWSVILSVGVSSLVGIVFGYYPAKKAANLDPIEALRYE